MYDKLLPLEFGGVFREHLKAFVLEKRGLGFRYGNSAVFLLQQFDRLSMGYDCSDGLSKELALAWTQRQPYQSKSTQQGRISLMRQFAIYLQRNGIKACVLPVCSSAHFYTY